MLFNDLLESVGIAVEDVRLLRHQTPEPGVLHQSIYELWRDDRSGFDRYQSVQRQGRRLFRTGSIWAAFVCPNPETTLFAGLYDARYRGAADVDWTCPYRGDRSFANHPYDTFTTTLRPELAQYIGKMPIEWNPENVRTWARYAQGAPFEVSEAFRPSKQSDQLFGDDLVEALGSFGFKVQHETKKVTQLRQGNLIAYVKRHVRVRPLVVHPHFLEFASALHTSSGADVELPPRPYINSNLVAFPAFDSPHRETAGRRGLAIGVTADQLPALISFLGSKSVIDTPDGPVRVVAPPEEPLTERERLQTARIGQGAFRDSLIAAWEGKCPATQIDHLTLLRASHIKSWAKSSVRERLDPFNGILLSANVDALFDRGLISFANDGTMLVSPAIDHENLGRIGIGPGHAISGLDPRHFPYLDYHRAEHFLQG